MEEKKNNKGLICLIICLIALVLGFVCYITFDKIILTKEESQNKINTTKSTTIKNTTNNIVNLISLTSTSNFVANNLKMTLENNIVYLTINNIKYNLGISNVSKLFTNKQKMSSFYNIYILTNNGKLYVGSLSTVREYKSEEIDTIKSYFSLTKTDKTIINIYKTEDEKIIYEDINNTYYYLSNNSLY